MTGHDPMSAEHAGQVDALTRSRYRTEDAEDRSGLLKPSEPLPPDATENERFDAVMGRYFPQVPTPGKE